MSWNTTDNMDPILQDWGEAYKELCALLKEKVPELKHVDLYYGQDQVVDSDGNWLPFRAPAVFLEFQAPQVNDLGDLCQQLDMDITVWVATETVQDTHHGSAGQRKAMEFVALMRKIHVALHNASGQHFSPLSRVGMQRKADAPPYMYMYGQTYRGVLLDNSTSPQLAYLYPPHQLEIEPVSAPVPPITPEPGVCPTVQELIPITTVQVIAESLTTQQAADLYVILGGTGDDLATLVGQATPEQIFAVMTPEQVSYVQGLLPPVQVVNTEGTPQGSAQGGAPPFVAADGVLRTTDNATVIQTIPSGKAEQAKQSQVRYLDAAGAEQLSAPVDTGYASGTLRPAMVVPRITIYEPDGATPHAYRDIADPAFVLPQPPAPGDPIIYNFGRHLCGRQITSYYAYDEAWLLASGWYDYDPVIGPESRLQRASNTWGSTLHHANVFGHHTRLTDEVGNVAATSGDRIVMDHLHGLMWGVFENPNQTYANWEAWMDAHTLPSWGGYSDWVPVTEYLYRTIQRTEAANRMGYAPWGVLSGYLIWTSNTNPHNTSQAIAYNNNNYGFYVGMSKAINSPRRGFLVRRFI